VLNMPIDCAHMIGWVDSNPVVLVRPVAEY